MEDIVVDETTVTTEAPTSRKGAIIALLAIVVLLTGFFFIAFAPKGTPVGGALPADPVGYMVPDITLDQLDGSGPLALRDLVGKPVVVNFWASWCTTCKDEAAIMGDAERKWRDKGVVFVGMDSSDKDADAKKFELLYGMDYTSLIDRDGLQSPDWGVTGYPETFFIGKDGRIVSKFISAIDAATLDDRIAEIL